MFVKVREAFCVLGRGVPCVYVTENDDCENESVPVVVRDKVVNCCTLESLKISDPSRKLALIDRTL